MATNIFVNLPVKDLSRSIDFFKQLGYSFNEQFTNESGACLVIEQNIYAMLVTEPFFSTFTKKTIADSVKTTEVIIALSAENRKEVDALADKAISSGGSKSNEPQDHGFMYSRSFQDPDGHLWEVFYMDPEYVEK